MRRIEAIREWSRNDDSDFEKEYMTMPYEKGRRYPLDTSKEVVDKIHQLDLKKGDVLLITINDDRGELPRHVFDKLVYKRCEAITDRVKHIYGDQVQIIFIPSSFDVSVIRLEEWFV